MQSGGGELVHIVKHERIPPQPQRVCNRPEGAPEHNLESFATLVAINFPCDQGCHKAGIHHVAKIQQEQMVLQLFIPKILIEQQQGKGETVKDPKFCWKQQQNRLGGQ